MTAWRPTLSRSGGTGHRTSCGVWFALQALAADPRVVLTGLAAAERAGARLVAAENGEVEGYVAESDIAGLYAAYGLVDAEEVAT